MQDEQTATLAERRHHLADAMARAAHGERLALQEIYDLTSAKLLAIILQVVRDRDAAEDVLQDVYIKIWARAGRFDPDRASPITWLSVIARNSAIDAVRKSGRRREVSDDGLPDIEDETPAADTMLCHAQDCEQLRDCIEQLQDNYRTSIRMAFFRGFTHAELSEQLDVPLGTIKSWVRRGLQSLRGCLGNA